LKQLFEQAPEGVAIMSTEERVVRINKELTRMFGYEPAEALGRTIQEIIVPKTDMCVNSGAAIEHRSKPFAAARMGLIFMYLYLAVPITTASREQVASYVIDRDIKERKRTAEQPRESEAVPIDRYPQVPIDVAASSLSAV
jgi:PAS domain S-box-containing protein